MMQVTKVWWDGEKLMAEPIDPATVYSDIVSDGGLDPRNKFDKPAQQEPVAYLCENAVGHKYFRWKRPSSTYKPIALYTSPPAQQEPVATDWERIARVQDAKLRAMCDEAGGFEKLCEVMDKYERTTPPAQQEPVAWRAPNWGHSDDEWVYRDFDDPVLIADGKPSPNNEPLYTSPQAPRTWVGLSDEEKSEIKKQANYNWETTAGEYASKVQDLTEAKLKEKNT